MRWLKKIIEAVITWCREFYRGIREKYGISEGDGRSLRSPRDLPAEEVEAYMKRQGIGSGSGGRRLRSFQPCCTSAKRPTPRA